MNQRKVHRIDVSKMSQKELCQTLDVEYIPWYRSSLFWCLVLCFTMPSVMLIFEALE